MTHPKDTLRPIMHKPAGDTRAGKVERRIHRAILDLRHLLGGGLRPA